MRVLIVDDDPNCRQILEIMLSRFGLALTIAVDGAQGVALARATQPELILMDLLMPEMTGLEAIHELRADPAFAAVPMIAVTALAFEADQKAAIAAGFDAVVTKPFSRRQLLEAITRVAPGFEQRENKVPA